ncbi:MAG: hypothetical protein EBR40_06250 [Proteobacteria bacterium]|nr:hypothetical protein [Pseudomonadota bacterium]
MNQFLSLFGLRSLTIAAVALSVWQIPALASAQDWGEYAIISNTLNVTETRVCIGSTNRSLACPIYTPTVNSAGLLTAANVSVTGNLSANRFIGDGSGLTGVVASSGDRIASGTTSMVAVSSSGFVSLTQSGVNTAWFDPQRGLVTLGVSSTGAISGTGGYFSGSLGIGVTNPAYLANFVGGTGGAESTLLELRSLGTNAGTGTNIRFTNSNNVGSTVRAEIASIRGSSADSNLIFRTSIGSGPIDRVTIASAGNVGIGISTPSGTLHVSGTARITSWTTIAANVTPTAPLDVYGTISATTVRANTFIGDGSGLTGVVASSGDRIASGTTSMLAVSNTGFVSLTQSGVNTAWFDPQRGLVTLGVSSTGAISGTGGYFSGSVGIGTTAPGASYKLDVAGAGNFTSFIDVGGTVFANGGNGVRITNNAYLKAPSSDVIGIYDRTAGALGTLIAGNVGIGTTAPNAKLDVVGAISATALYVTSTTGTVSATFVNANTISATNIYIGGVAVGNATPDRIVSGTSSVIANSNRGVSVSTPLEVSGSLTLAATGSENCTTSNYGTLRFNPTTNRLELCYP